MDFSKGVLYFKSIQKGIDRTKFVTQNKDIIYSILPFIYHSNKFVHELIQSEELDEKDNIRLKKLFFRNQNRYTLDFHSMNTMLLQIEEEELEKGAEGLSEFRKKLFDVKVSMTKAILHEDYAEQL